MSESILSYDFEETILKVINIHIENVFELSNMLNLAQCIPYCGYLSEKLQDGTADKAMSLCQELPEKKDGMALLAEAGSLTKELADLLIERVEVYNGDRVEIKWKIGEIKEE